MLGLVLGQAGTVSAAAFSIDPTQIRLSARAPSTLLTIRNESPQPVRLQLSAFAWHQSLEGEMQLQPARDVVFFPSVFELAPSQERKIRVGTTAAFGAAERSYRLFIEELPADPSAAVPGSGVQMRTRISVPVFLAPASPRAGAALRDVRLVNGALSFRLENTGTVHFTPQAVRVRATSQTGEGVFERNVNAWYVLAGGARVFTVTLPRLGCERVRALAIDVTLDGTVLSERLDAPGGTCGT